ncbi:hypothetical protein HYZ05_01700 [Candidatus Daviesbacteria bacterium]|nr:hypothetical protein [Candidatus Daviesbacteria bacterium]
MSKITGYSYVPQILQDPKGQKFIQSYLPLIPIKVAKPNGQISPPFDALLDSGSDRNLFPMSLSKYLGIVFEKMKPGKIYGIGKNPINAYPARITLWLGNKSYETETDFSIQQNIPILGRQGFFDLFKSIKFDEKGQFVYMEE